MQTIDDVFDYVMLQLRFVPPETLVRKQIEASYESFVRDSLCFKDTIVVPKFDSMGEQSLFSAFPILSVSEVRLGSGVIVPPFEYSFELFSSILSSRVLSDMYNLSVLCSIFPSIDDSSVNANFFTSFGVAVGSHACAELSANEKEPWAQYSKIELFLSEYQKGVKIAKRRTSKNLTIRPA